MVKAPLQYTTSRGATQCTLKRCRAVWHDDTMRIIYHSTTINHSNCVCSTSSWSWNIKLTHTLVANCHNSSSHIVTPHLPRSRKYPRVVDRIFRHRFTLLLEKSLSLRREFSILAFLRGSQKWGRVGIGVLACWNLGMLEGRPQQLVEKSSDISHYPSSSGVWNPLVSSRGSSTDADTFSGILSAHQRSRYTDSYRRNPRSRGQVVWWSLVTSDDRSRYNLALWMLRRDHNRYQLGGEGS